MARVFAAIVARRYSADGLAEALTPIGTRLHVDLDQIVDVNSLHPEWLKVHTKALVRLVTPCDCPDDLEAWHNGGWFPLDLLELPMGAMQ